MNANDPPVLQVRNLAFQYDQPLLDIDTFLVARGECVGLIGPSGCGKTTFIHLIAGLLKPTRGSIQVNGIDLSQLTETQTDRLRGQSIGIVFQRLYLIPSLSVIDNLTLAQSLSRVSVDKPYAIQLLEQLGVGELLNSKPYQLSQGQAQRVAIARSLAHRPSLVMADEPTSALDDKNAQEAIAILRTMTQTAGAALAIVTHDQRVRDQVDRVFNLGSDQ
mgnify:CR=1 FL=1